MKKLNIAATGYYGSTESWKWVASSYEMIAELLGKLIHRDDPVIITGVNVVGNNVSDGFISYAGELFFFKGGAKTDTVVIIENVTEQEYNTNPSGSGTMPTYPTYIDRYAKCGQSGEGVDEFDFDDFTRLDELISISERTKQATVNTLGVARIIHPTDVAIGNDDESILTIKKLVDYRKATENQTGIVELATNTESAAGTDAQRAVTPAGLKYTLDNSTFGVVDSFEITNLTIQQGGGNLTGSNTFNLTNNLSKYIVLASLSHNTQGDTDIRFIYAVNHKNVGSFDLEWSIWSGQDAMDNGVIQVIVMKIP